MAYPEINDDRPILASQAQAKTPGRFIAPECFSIRRGAYQPKPAPTPTELSLPLNEPPMVTLARGLMARW